MSTALELEEKLDALTDQVQDIFHATRINMEALRVQMNHKNTPKQLAIILTDCDSKLKNLEQSLAQRSTLRLNYLITEQIKEEEAKVRRQRLNDYEQKILDQRRLISDKQSFYENLLRPKKKRPQHLTVDEFQEARKKEISEEENRKFSLLKEQVSHLNEFYNLIKKENNRIEFALKQEERMQKEEADRFDISEDLRKSQVLYLSLSKSLASSERTKIMKQLFNSIQSIREENKTLIKEYMEQKEMEQYLQWEKQKLIDQYKLAKEDLMNCRKSKQETKKTPIFIRPVSR